MTGKPFDSADEAEQRKQEAFDRLIADMRGIELATVRACHVTPERVKWLWPGRIPAGKVTVLDGDPGLGKSSITLDLTARLTTGTPLPDGHKPERPVCVLLLSAEDGAADTIVPRLKVAGADLRKVTIVDHVADEAGGPRPVELPGDAELVERWLASYLYTDDDAAAPVFPGMVIVDPLMAYLGGEVNAHRDQDVRRALYPLKLLAERTGVAVLVVRHLNKMAGANPLYRGGGSIGIIGAARAGLLVGVDPDDEHRRILAVSKSNLAAKAPSLAYKLVGEDLYDTARVVWQGTSEHTAEDLLGRPVERAAPKQEEAEDFLRQQLAKQARPVTWLQTAAKQKGISWRTVERAKAALEVIVERRGEPGKRGGGSYWWRLPGGQVSINSATTNTTPVGGLNEGGGTAGQGPDLDPGGINSATPPQEEDHHDRHPPPGAEG
jgi:putative DNA primase/helicase